MHCIAEGGLPVRAGFIHLPWLHEQVVSKAADSSSLSRQTMVAAVRLALETCLGLPQARLA